MVDTPLTLPPRVRMPAGQSPISIRPYGDDDAGEVAALWRASAVEWPGGGPFGGRNASADGVRHEQRARQPLETFLAWAVDRDTGASLAVGYCSLLAQPDDHSATYIGLLTAHPAWHGHGVGRDLLIASLERTIGLGYDRVDLHTWSGNLKAVPLYKKVGFFWVPDTSVRMANYLPMVLRLAPVVDYFAKTGVDWYADGTRTLDVRADLERHETQDVYTYTWGQGPTAARAVIDRHANALTALELPDLALRLGVDDTRLPIGTTRAARFQIVVPDGRPTAVSTIVASAEGAVRTDHQAHRTVDPNTRAEVQWSVEGVLSAPAKTVRPGITAPDLVRVLAIINDTPIRMACAIRVVPPISLTVDDIAPLIPGKNRRAWVEVDNERDEPITTVIRATSTGPFEISSIRRTDDLASLTDLSNQLRPSLATASTDNGSATSPALRRRPTSRASGASVSVAIAPRSRVSIPFEVTAHGAGDGTLTVAAHLSAPDITDSLLRPAGKRQRGGTAARASSITSETGETAPSTVTVPLHAGPPGVNFIEQTEAHVRVITDDLIVTAPLSNVGWQPAFTVVDRHTGRPLMRHSCGLGPPFSPSTISSCTWTPKIASDAGGVSITLSAQPDSLPGTTFERLLRISPSSLIDLRFRLVNGSSSALSFDVQSSVAADLDGVQRTRIAAVVDGALTIDESDHFPDWEEPSNGATHLTEQWIAEYGDGLVVGAAWTDATDFTSDSRLAELVLPLGAIAPGESATTETLRLYAGPGDWHTVRARWRSLTGEAPKDIASFGAHSVTHAQTVNPVLIGTPDTVAIRITHANDAPVTGLVALAIDGHESSSVAVTDLRAGHVAHLRTPITLPDRVGAFAATVCLHTPETTIRRPVALIRVGDGLQTVRTTVDDGPLPAVTLDTGAMRVRLLPTQRARIVAIETPVDPPLPLRGEGQDVETRWVNHLLSSVPDPRPWVWFNPWYGGISTHLRESGWHTGATPLDRAHWEWQITTTNRGRVPWTGVTATAKIVAPRSVATLEDGALARLAGTTVAFTCLVAGGGTTIATETRVYNGSRTRLRGTISTPTYWQPGGSVDGAVAHYGRRGDRMRNRVHGAHWSGTEGWVAITAGDGRSVATLITADAETMMMAGDMGLHGVHPFVSRGLDLAPGEVQETALWVAIAQDLAEAQAYRHLARVGLPASLPLNALASTSSSRLEKAVEDLAPGDLASPSSSIREQTR